MFNSRRNLTYCALVLLFPMLVMVTSTGCIRQMAQLLYVIKGHQIPAKFPGLEDKRVAVVCISDESAYGPDTLTYTVSKYVCVKLSQGLKKGEIISPVKVENWVDEHGWDPTEVVDLGNDLQADAVLVIEVGSYSIHEGATIFKGRADISTTVYDIEKNGQVTFAHGPEEYTFPKNGRASIQTSDRKFEAFYLARLTDHISKLFIPHDKMESFADDAISDF